MSHTDAPTPGLYGLLAEFDSPQTLLDAAHRGRARPATRRPTRSRRSRFTASAEALGFKDRRISKIVLAGGITGMLGGYGLEYWTQVIAYPMNIGGRPFHSWVSFIPPAFETTILLAALLGGVRR